MIRKKRKREHLLIASRLKDGPCSTGFEDIRLIHHSVPELDLEEIDPGIEFLGKGMEYPLIINALTGGTDQAKRINKALAYVAEKYGIALAVGSQTIALEDSGLRDTFAVVREMNPGGVILANLSANRSVEEALEAIDMIQADGLQLHLNVPQELTMKEGDRCFRGILKNVSEIVTRAPVPVFAKEVGFGFSREAALELYTAGIRYMDNGGQGGTNFLAIENQRKGLFGDTMNDWGIPTAISLAEVVSLQLPIFVVVSGGIRTASDVVKALILGADAVSITGLFLNILLTDGIEALDQFMENLLYQIRAVFLMIGAHNCQELKQKPLIITGTTAQWLYSRGIDPQQWSR
ncbi:MAG: type 2 isopentenyl-diphosphate Delta-isomerase [Bacillota bacterium]|nr:type 2 isopentenyl-diphosphate Delta-isomerase [Bacillota bacterium]